MRNFTCAFIIGATLILPQLLLAAEPNESFLWHLRKTSWSLEDEKAYENFVHVLGQTKCNTVTKCLNSPANPFLKTRPALPPLSVDCSKLPYFIRAYFAWANDLPFSFVTEVVPLGQGAADSRYSKSGNQVIGRTDVVAPVGKAPNVIKVLSFISNYVASSVYRIDPASEVVGHYSDFYPVKLAPESVRPGTVFYDVDGHLVLVYQVEKDGRVLYMDSHPDNSLTRGTYGPKFARSNPRMGGGFKNWRPIELTNAQQQPGGTWVGGKIVQMANDKIGDYSLEQYLGNQPDAGGDWKKGTFAYRGHVLPYQEYLRAVLSGGQFRLNPLNEFANSLKELCGYLTDRIASVDQALKAGLNRAEHPEAIPTNIFGAEGDWETYSTASRDLRVRTMFRDVVVATSQSLVRYASHDPAIDYSGADLKMDLQKVYKAEVAHCPIIYQNSSGAAVELSVDDVRARAFKISFDPYDCVEHRWGANVGAEAASCTNDATKNAWYEREKPMRRLQTRVPDINAASAPDYLNESDLDILKVLGL